MLEDLLDSARSQLLIIFCVILPISVTLATSHIEATVQELNVFRLNHYDFQGNPQGSRGWRVSYEAVGLGNKGMVRKGVVVWWKDLLSRTLPPNIGAAIIVIPESLSSLSEDDQQAFIEFESTISSSTYQVPVYLTQETPEVKSTLQSLQSSLASQQASAVSALMEAVTANAFQLVSSMQSNSVLIEKPLLNVLGKLSAFERGAQFPTVLIVAHYDTFGAAPGLSQGSEANGSGVVGLLELLRIFHQLYLSPKTRPKYNLQFLLTSGGKLNYQGARQWIEEHLDQEDGVNLELAVCLDTIGNGDELNVHLSKIPKEGSPSHRFYSHIQNVASKKNKKTEMIQKKINLGDPLLAWEHERFNIRKLRALTLSRLQSPKDTIRRTILDTPDKLNQEALVKNIEIIAEALFAYLYNLPSEQLMDKESISAKNVEEWLGRLKSAGGRSLPELASLGPESPIVADFLNYFDHHSHQSNFVPIATDKKEPEFVVYGGWEDKMSVHQVKPAVFDLLLAAFIAAYLAATYYAVIKFQWFFGSVRIFSGQANGVSHQKMY